MASEIDSLDDQGTWVLENLPPGKRNLGSKWVYTAKRDEDGNLIRLKAKLVCLSNNQVEGIYYNENFSPVVKMATVKTFPAVATIKEREVHQMDVQNDYIHGDIEK